MCRINVLSILATLLAVTCRVTANSLLAKTSKERRDIEYTSCLQSYEIHRDKIIRTEESKLSGAKYLNGKDSLTKTQCMEFCCSTVDCDVFVYEEKELGSCYLFACGGPEDFKCKFTRHKSYSSGVLINAPSLDLEDEIKYTRREHELNKLGKHSETIQYPIASSGQKSSSISVTDKFDRKTDYSKIFESRGGCSRYQFECRNSGECIAVYNVCDGIPQCPDRSDEDRCPQNNARVINENKVSTTTKSAEIATMFVAAPPARYNENNNMMDASKNLTEFEAHRRKFAAYNQYSVAGMKIEKSINPFAPPYPIFNPQQNLNPFWYQQQFPNFGGTNIIQPQTPALPFPYYNFGPYTSLGQLPYRNGNISNLQLANGYYFPIGNAWSTLPQHAANTSGIQLLEKSRINPASKAVNLRITPVSKTGNLEITPVVEADNMEITTPVFKAELKSDTTLSPPTISLMTETKRDRTTMAPTSIATSLSPITTIITAKSTYSANTRSSITPRPMQKLTTFRAPTFPPSTVEENIISPKMMEISPENNLVNNMEYSYSYAGPPTSSIVVLILSLIMTAILVIAIFSQVRFMRKKIRRGRLRGNDSDHLVNGMYL